MHNKTHALCSTRRVKICGWTHSCIEKHLPTHVLQPVAYPAQRTRRSAYILKYLFFGPSPQDAWPMYDVDNQWLSSSTHTRQCVHNEIISSSPPHPQDRRRLRLPFIESWKDQFSGTTTRRLCLVFQGNGKCWVTKPSCRWYLLINHWKNHCLLPLMAVRVAKEYMLLISKIPVRSGCCSSFRLCLYVQITNTMVQKQQISLT